MGWDTFAGRKEIITIFLWAYNCHKNKSTVTGPPYKGEGFMLISMSCLFYDSLTSRWLLPYYI